MTQRVDVTLFGFKIGKYTYFFKKKALWRFNPRNGKKMLLHQQLYGGSLRYKIQDHLYSNEELKQIYHKVKIYEELPF